MSYNYTSGSIGGSSTPGVKYTYLGFSQTKTNNSLNTQQTYQSTKDQLQWMRDHEDTWAIGYQHPTYGRLESIQIEQKDTFWNATVNYTNPLNNGITITTPDNLPYNTNLDITMLSLPLEKHPKYVYNWNHLLISPYPLIDLRRSGLTIPDPTKISKDLAMEMYNVANGTIRWIKDQSQIPLQREQITVYDQQGHVVSTTFAPWVIASIGIGDDEVVSYTKIQRQKPGVEYYEIPTYEITEWGQYKSKSQCNWALIEGGKLAFPILGDFGIQNYYHPDFLTATPQITAGFWLCEGGNITFDGKYYNATCKYIWSPQPSGWDQDLYDFFSGFAYYKQKSQANPNPIVGTTTNGGSIFDGHGNTQGNVTNPIIPDNNEGD